MVGWLVGCLVVWLVVSLISDSLVASLIVWLVDCLVVYLFVGYLLRFLFVCCLFVFFCLFGWLVGRLLVTCPTVNIIFT